MRRSRSAGRFFRILETSKGSRPGHLDFVVFSELPSRVHPGMMIEYRVRPLFGIPVTWLTEITHIDEPRTISWMSSEVGPYRLWHHEHSFIALGDGQDRGE